MSVGVVIGQNLFVTEPLLTHDGSPILTHADPMAGAVPLEDESAAGGAKFIEITPNFVPAKLSPDCQPECFRAHEAGFRTCNTKPLCAPGIGSIDNFDGRRVIHPKSRLQICRRQFCGPSLAAAGNTELVV